MTREKSITITHTSVQWQSGSSDCGLFALAFATSLCQGFDPANISYDQQQMRNHLLQCICRGNISAFPHRSLSRRATKMSRTRTEIVQVFCVCRLPDNGETMIQCASCEEWFHRSCMSIPKKYINSQIVRYCNRC